MVKPWQFLAGASFLLQHDPLNTTPPKEKKRLPGLLQITIV
jgi:hypothetical protein